MEYYQKLVTFTSQKSKSKPAVHIDKNDLWMFMYQIAKNQINTFAEFINLFMKYVELEPSFRDSVPKEITESINKLTDVSVQLDDRINEALPLVVIATFFPKDEIIALTNNIIEMVADYLGERKELPYKLLKHIDNFVVTSLKDSVTEKLFSTILSLIDSPNGPAALAVYAAITPDFYENLEIADRVNSLINKYIEKQDFVLSSLYMISLYYNSERGNANLIKDKVIPLIGSKNLCISMAATKTVLKSIQSELINNSECLEAVIKLYPSCKSKQLFKVIKKFVVYDDDDDEVTYEIDEEIAEMISEFVVKVLNEVDDPLIKGYCIDIVSALAESCPMYVDNCYQDVLDSCLYLIKEGQYDAFSRISTYFVTLLKLFRKQTEDTIAPSLHKLSELLAFDDKIKEFKQSFVLANNLAELTKSEDLGKYDFSSQIAEFALNKLLSDNRENQLRSIGVILNCAKCFNESHIIKFIDRIITLASNTESYDEVNLFMMAFHEFMNSYSLEQVHIFLQFTENIFSSRISLLNGVNLIHPIPLIDSLFDFLSDFCIKYPTNQTVILKASEWLDDNPDYAFNQICDVLKNAISIDSGNEGIYLLIAQKILAILPKIYAPESISKASEVIQLIYDLHHECITPIDDYINIFSNSLLSPKIIHSSNRENEEICSTHAEDGNKIKENNKHENEIEEEEEEEEFEEEEESNDELKVPIMKLILSIYLSEKNMKVNMDVILRFFDLMPFDNNLGFENFIIDLNKAISEDGRFYFAKMGLATLYVDILITDNHLPSKFNESTIEMMKHTFSEMIKNDRSIQKAVYEQIGKSKESIQKLEAILQ